MPCEDCLGRTEQDRFITVSRFDYNCACSTSSHVDWAEGCYDTYLVSLDEFREFFDLIPNPVPEPTAKLFEDHHLSEYFICFEDIPFDDIPLFEEKVGADLADYRDFLDLSVTCSGIETYSTLTCGVSSGGDTWTSLMWKLKDGAKPEFRLDNLMVIDTVGQKLDTFLKNHMLFTYLISSDVDGSFLKVNDYYVSLLSYGTNDYWNPYIKGAMDDSVIGVYDDRVHAKAVNITFTDLEHLLLDKGVFTYEKDGTSFTFGFQRDEIIIPDISNHNSFGGFISAIEKSDALEVEGFEEICYLDSNDCEISTSIGGEVTANFLFRNDHKETLLLSEKNIKSIWFQRNAWKVTLKEDNKDFYITLYSLSTIEIP
jgi:hypothetical protein